MTSAAFPLRERTEGRAVASLILGIAGFVIFPVMPSIVAIWLGFSAKRRIRDDASLKGDGVATAGIVLGILALVIAVAGFMFLAALRGSASPAHMG